MSKRHRQNGALTKDDPAVDTGEIVELSEEFAALARELHTAENHTAALTRVVELAVKHVDGCDFASVTVVRDGIPSTLASSDSMASLADQLQYEYGEGPCLRSAEDDQKHLLFDVETESRWPAFTAALLKQTPIRCVLALPLVAHDEAALNLFALSPAAFTDEDVDISAILAAHTASLVALHVAESRATNLEVALGSNRGIGMAIGILMAHRRVTHEAAFELLKTASQTLQRKVRDVAAEVVETGTLPARADLG
jgi:GAF domain-containing protein